MIHPPRRRTSICAVKHAQTGSPFGKSAASAQVFAPPIPIQFGVDADLRHGDCGGSWSVDGDRFIRCHAIVRDCVLRVADPARDLRDFRTRRHAGFRHWGLNSLVDAPNLETRQFLFFNCTLASNDVHRMRSRGRNNTAMD
jgi:hypothetical protein